MTIHVTQQDIDVATAQLKYNKHNKYSRCFSPIVIAARRTLKKPVGWSHLHPYPEAYVSYFFHGFNVEPTTFELELSPY